MGVALPVDTDLMADLTTPRYEIRSGEPPKIYVQSKDDIIKELGHSPDKGDSVVYAWAAGDVYGRGGRKKVLHTPSADAEYDVLRK
jgi:hypothetical protein